MIISICAIAAIVITLVIMFFSSGGLDFGDFCISLFVGAAGVLVGGMIAAAIGATAESTPIVANTYSVYAVTDNYSLSSYTSGNVFLITSSTDNELKYNYLYNEDGKGLTFKSVNAEDCYINTTTEEPYVEIIQYQLTSPFLRWLMDDIYFKQSYNLYLPAEAEIIHEYVIDLQ